MTPNPTIRLQSILQTLEHVIVPAVDGQNSLAQEQCGLVLGQLRMLIQHMPYFGEYHALCYRDLTETLNRLSAPRGGAVSAAAAEKLSNVAKQAAAIDDALVAYHLLGNALERLMRAAAVDGAPDYRSEINALVFEFSKRQSLRARTWFKDAGFDHAPDELASLQEMLGHGGDGENAAD
jgi:hypothetical protein